MPILKQGKIIFIVGLLTTLSQGVLAGENWKLSLKNAYIDRDFENPNLADQGSWSQGVSLFYDSKFYPAPIKGLEIGLDANLQYAVRLSSDKHVSDNILPFDGINQNQASDFAKYGGTLKFKYNDHVLKVGEIWMDSPMASVDASRQLTATYLGTTLQSQITPELNVEIGHITHVSPRNSEKHQKLSFTQNGNKSVSDGLSFMDLDYKLNEQIQLSYSYGHFENIMNKHYLGLDHQWEIAPALSLRSRIRYFNLQDSGENAQIDSQNIGILETLKFNNHTISGGVQKIKGDAFPLLDGFLPELYFINWNVTTFSKKNEQSYHFIYAYNFKDSIPGLNTVLKYSYGEDIDMGDQRDHSESELNLIASYQFQDEKFKGIGLQYIYIDYDSKYGHDFAENRFFLTYNKTF